MPLKSKKGGLNNVDDEIKENRIVVSNPNDDAGQGR